MKGLFKQNSKQINEKLKCPKEYFLTKFSATPYHQWIERDKFLNRLFQSFFSHFSLNHLETLNRVGPILFVKSNARYSCSFQTSPKANIIILFPDLLKMLYSGSPTHGLAVLAHEIGHIFYRHSELDLVSLHSQIEADDFAYSLGLGQEILDILKEYPNSEECKRRAEILQEKLQN